MKLSYMLAAAILSAASLAACQQQHPATAEPQVGAPAVEASTTEASTEASAIGDASACPVIAHRRWVATLATRPDGSSTLTVSGQVDLPKPGYSVSFTRDPSENVTTNEPHLSLLLTPPSRPVDAAVTAHPAYYFAPAMGQHTIVHIMCEGTPLTDINVVTGQ